MSTPDTVKAILRFLLNHRYIGGKHTPEDKLIKSKTKWVSTEEKTKFKKEYKYLINEHFIIRSRKRTGKGFDWHISLNSKKLGEAFNLIQ